MALIVGTPESFAIESDITQAFSQVGQRALGYFVVHIEGKAYGVLDPEASLLACSYDEVVERLRQRGGHRFPLLSTVNASAIVNAYLDAHYRQTSCVGATGLGEEEFSEHFLRNAIAWAPDGDEAFDDGSHILQFDVDDRVRLIAFVNTESSVDVVNSIVEIWLDADVFYGVLSEWSEQFTAEWKRRLQDVAVEGN